MPNSTDLSDEFFSSILTRFGLSGTVVDAEQWRSGHINSTYCATVAGASGAAPRRYVVQRVNSHVFPDTSSLMHNAFRVAEHNVNRVAAERGITPDEASRDNVRFLLADDGRPWIPDPSSSDVWRVYPCIENVDSHLVAASPALAREAAMLFGSFQNAVADLGGERLAETIPDFHNTPKRFDRLVASAEADVKGRLAAVRPIYEEMLARRERGGRLQRAYAEGVFPERIVHNDTKMSNALFRHGTTKGVCVIDLDTVMPGYALHDFGDLMRTACNREEEDTEDLGAIRVDMNLYEAIVDGYVSSARGMLRPDEVRLLPEAGWAMTMEVGIRFFTDYLDGDVYFRIARPDHNLIRAKSQLTFAKRIEEAMPALQAIADKAAASL